MSKPEDPTLDRVAVQRLRKRSEGFAHGLGIGDKIVRQIAEQVIADMPSQPDEDRLKEARRRLLIARGWI